MALNVDSSTLKPKKIKRMNKLDRKPRNNLQPNQTMFSKNVYFTFLCLLSYFGYNYGWNLIPRLPRFVESVINVERCNENWIKENISEIENDLKRKVFGQPFLEKALIPQLLHHLKEGNNPIKPLVMSFHGSPGTGKTYVSQIMADNIFVKGRNSGFYKHFTMADVHGFTQEELVNEIKNLVSKCPKSMFVFDEIEKMPHGTFEAIKSFLDYYHSVGNVDFRKSIFIFISNIGMDVINSLALSQWHKGKKREDYSLSEFENVLREALYEADGGLKKTMIVKNFLIDLYLPFLPLEKEHVEKCVKTIEHDISPKRFERLVEEMLFVPEEYPIYSFTGCKGVFSRVKRRYRDEL